LREFATRDRIEGHHVNPHIPAKESNEMIINAATQASKTLDRQRDVDDAGEAFSLSKKMSVFD